MRALLISILLLTASASFASKAKPLTTEFEDLVFKGMENFTVEKKNGKVHIGFDYVIQNPNKLTVVIKPSSLFLKIAEQDCGWVVIEDKIKIKKKSEAGYPFKLKGDASNFVKSSFASIWSVITGKGISFNLKGDLNAGIVVFKKKWPMDFTYMMTNDEFMSFF